MYVYFYYGELPTTLAIQTGMENFNQFANEISAKIAKNIIRPREIVLDIHMYVTLRVDTISHIENHPKLQSIEAGTNQTSMCVHGTQAAMGFIFPLLYLENDLFGI